MTKASGTPWKLKSRGHYSWIIYTVFKKSVASQLRSWLNSIMMMTPKKVNQKYFVQEREEEDREGTHQEYEKASREMKGG